jgi:hypothetical protein
MNEHKLYLYVTYPGFVDSEIFGQSAVVDLLEELGFVYASETPQPGFGYEYIFQQRKVELPESAFLETAVRLLDFFTALQVEIGADNHLCIELPLYECDELTVLP